MDKGKIGKSIDWLWKNGWKTPGIGLFFYPFKTDRKGFDAVKHYVPHFALGIPTILKIVALATIVGTNYFNKEGEDLGKNNRLEQSVDSVSIFPRLDTINYFEAADKYFKY